MADFNVKVPETQAPNYGYFSRPISEPRADISGATKGQAIGSALHSLGGDIAAGLNLANTVQQEDITKNISTKWDSLVNEYTQQLSDVDSVLKGKSQDVPQSLKSLPGTVDSLISLRNTGKLSETEFMMRRDAIVKQARAEHPGQREFIDNEFYRLTEKDPANKVVQQMVGDINASATALKEHADKVDTVLLHAIADGQLGQDGPKIRSMYLNHEISAEQALTIVNQGASAHYQKEQAILDFKLRKDAGEDVEKRSQGSFGDLVSMDMGRDIDSWALSMPGFKDPVSFKDMQNRVMSGELKLSDAEYQQFGAASDHRKQAWITSMMAKLTTPGPGGGPSPAQLMGGIKKAREIVEENAKQYDVFKEAMLDPKTGMAFATMNALRAIKDANTLRWVQSDVGGIGQWLLNLHSVNELAGKDNLVVIQHIQNFLTHFPGFKTPSGEDMSTVMLGEMSKTFAQPRSITSNGNFFTVTKAMDDIWKSGVAKSGTDGAAATQEYLDGVSKAIGDKKQTSESIRTNAAHAAYDPSNDYMYKFDKDHIDPQTGQMIKGRNTVFNQFFGPDQAKAMKKAGPDQWNQFINAAQFNFGRIFQAEILELNQRQFDSPNTIGWDSDNPKWKLNPGALDDKLRYVGSNTAIHPSVSAGYATAKEAIDNLNRNIPVMVNIAKMQGIDPNQYLFETFLKAGLNPKTIDPSSYAGHMLKSIVESQKAQ